MTPNLQRDAWNAYRDPGGRHYESYFLRANHPERPLAFWIRYTMLRSRERGRGGRGELWAVWFDGEAETIVVAKEEMPLERCSFARRGLGAQIGHAVLSDASLYGTARQAATELSWELGMSGGAPPLLLLAEPMYGARLPRAKAVVPRPFVRFDGELKINGATQPIDGWVGSQNHNWGSRHTDQYAWGQVVGFDEDPDAMLECASARLRFGPLWTPQLTTVVVRLGERDIALNDMRQTLRARTDVSYFDWRLESADGDVTISAHIWAPQRRFVGLRYGNPPGGFKTCLNSKLAACELRVKMAGEPDRVLTTRDRAAFEILTDDTGHGVAVSA